MLATARAWLGVLDASDRVYLPARYHHNFGKRLVKTPTLYAIEVGLAAWLLGIRDATLALHTLRGALFETLIVAEVLEHRRHSGASAHPSFRRDTNGLEANLMMDADTELQPVEIESGRTVTTDSIRATKKPDASSATRT